MSPFVVCVAIGKLVLKKEVEKTTMEKGFELCKSTEKKEKCDCESSAVICVESFPAPLFVC